MTVTVRRAVAGDEGEVLRLVVALATYEKQPDAVKATAASIRAALFGEDARVFAHLAELDGRAVGLALWFLTYSTWTGSPSLYLEDIYVDTAVQGRGVGRELFHALARAAAALGCGRIDWAVLDWNEPAMAFYRALGAERLTGWHPWRLDGEALTRFVEISHSREGGNP